MARILAAHAFIGGALAIRGTASGEPPLPVAITGWGRHDDRRKAEAAGFDHHMTKRVELDPLTSLLARHASAPQGAAPSPEYGRSGPK